ncbi:type II toxin-antitoxin system RelE/ParE family toxin [Caulobacter sp. ErkDOM-YI]|uniref:type II toxin-antitoxin system RelE/ParE family toxin n=1 Tax=unclassified Caulobacter TaxID=2648921 RepID=UPI003AF6CF09
MIRAVTFSPEARDDLIELYDYIAGRGAPNAALAYVTRRESRCLALADYPEQGQSRSDIRPGLRLLGFERRTEIAFHVTTTHVVIDGFFHGGQDVTAAFDD